MIPSKRCISVPIYNSVEAIKHLPYEQFSTIEGKDKISHLPYMGKMVNILYSF